MQGSSYGWLQWSGCGKVVLSHEASQVSSLGEQRKRQECKDRWRERVISWEVLIASYRSPGRNGKERGGEKGEAEIRGERSTQRTVWRILQKTTTIWISEEIGGKRGHTMTKKEDDKN